MLCVLRQHSGGGRDPCASGIGEVWLCIAKKEGDISASKLKINPCYAGISPYPFQVYRLVVSLNIVNWPRSIYETSVHDTS